MVVVLQLDEKAAKPVTTVQDCVSTFVTLKQRDTVFFTFMEAWLHWIHLKESLGTFPAFLWWKNTTNNWYFWRNSGTECFQRDLRTSPAMFVSTKTHIWSQTASSPQILHIVALTCVNKTETTYQERLMKYSPRCAGAGNNISTPISDTSLLLQI